MKIRLKGTDRNTKRSIIIDFNITHVFVRDDGKVFPGDININAPVPPYLKTVSALDLKPKMPDTILVYENEKLKFCEGFAALDYVEDAICEPYDPTKHYTSLIAQYPIIKHQQLKQIKFKNNGNE